jgi:hypothetical protein
MAHNTAAYFGDEAGPGSIQKHIAGIQASGLTTVILFALHVGRIMPEHPNMKIGDLIFNNYPQYLLVSGGKFNPNNSPEIATWPAQVAQLKQQGSVSKIFICIGGDGSVIYDFRTIQKMFAEGTAGTLRANITALKAAFTINGVCAIDGFDIDCEESEVSPNTIVQFCQMLFQQAFAVTFCPYTDENYWQRCMQPLWNLGLKVSWWNLQCYAGGHNNRNDLRPWINALAAVVGAEAAPSFLLPGLAVKGVEDTSDGQCPTGPQSIWTTFRGWNNPRLAGGFLWKYAALVDHPTLCSGQNNLATYVKAINDALDDRST